MHFELFYFFLFILAFLYAAVGHGGASGYLALMALYGIAPQEMKPTALVLNLFVSLTSFIQYYRGHYFKRNLF
ncbi:MAG: sulfite exporter TauE/SafE family protein, partial [Sphingobacterium sp.]